MVAEKEFTEERSIVVPANTLVTERLVMRAPHEGDVEKLVQLADNRRVAEMLARVPNPYTEKDARAFVDFAAKADGAIYGLTLAEPGMRPGAGPASGELIGVAGLEPRSNGEGLELGYWIGEPFWRQGFATEAAHALVDYGFRRTDVQAIHASCRVINPASRRVIHKCGFQYAGQGMLNSLIAGRVPVERYRLDRRTWASLKSWRGV